jgi:hypothetical protein
MRSFWAPGENVERYEVLRVGGGVLRLRLYSTWRRVVWCIDANVSSELAAVFFNSSAVGVFRSVI